MNSVADCLGWGRQALGGDAAAASEAGRLLAHRLDRPDIWLIAHPEAPVEPAAAADYRALIERRADGCPVAYLTGHKEFWSLEIKVSPAVLVPRPESECLVEAALAAQAHLPPGDWLDLGCGSGAVGLALAGAEHAPQVWLTDRSEAALAVAAGNARRLGLEVTLCAGDWYAATPDQRFALIVCNPPYVSPQDPQLEPGVARFEPAEALFAPPDGLSALRRVIAGAPAHLQPGGLLAVEHAPWQAAAVDDMLALAGLCNRQVRRDIEGRARVSCAWAIR